MMGIPCKDLLASMFSFEVNPAVDKNLTESAENRNCLLTKFDYSNDEWSFLWDSNVFYFLQSSLD
jgi:hypothetical protein